MTLPLLSFYDLFDETFVSPDSHNVRAAFEDQLKQQHKEKVYLNR